MRNIEHLMLHNNRGGCLPSVNFDAHYEEWRKHHSNEFVYGPIVKHSWQVNGKPYERLNPRNDGLSELPDASGFLLCENVKRIDNLLLLDAYGKERMRLSIPWEMTGEEFVEGGKEQTFFLGLTSPWPNPKTGEEGKFGVKTCALDRWGMAYYFELDYHSGKFLWCYGLQRG